MRLGYFVPEFPSQTHIFCWREVVALRGLGVQVHLLSSRRPAPGAASAGRTVYSPPGAPGRATVRREHRGRAGAGPEQRKYYTP